MLSGAINITMATGKAIIPGGLGWPIRSAMKAEIANPPKNAIAAMIRVVIVAPGGSSNGHGIKVHGIKMS